MKTLIKNARTLGKYIGSSEELVLVDVLIENDKVSIISNNIEDDDANVIDAKKNLLLPRL